MKYLLVVSCLVLLGFSKITESPDDFDNELSEIVRKFKEGINDKNECENQKRNAEDLSKEIEDAIRKEDGYTSEEIDELIILKRETKAMEEYIGAVGACGNYIPAISDFNLANLRVGGRLVNVIKDKYCVDVISVSIGEYIVYLCENNSSKNYTVNYKWKAQNGVTSGKGTMGLSNSTVRHIYDNREKTKTKNIVVSEITCVEF